jgi:hypothetical protein
LEKNLFQKLQFGIIAFGGDFSGSTTRSLLYLFFSFHTFWPYFLE